jgi:tetratricopeptide (TPR) repeat protein
MRTIRPSRWEWLPLAALLLAGCASSPEATRDRHLERGKKLLAEKEYARALIEFQGAIQAMPQDLEATYQYGLAAAAAGDATTAVKAFRKVLASDPKHVGAQLKLAGMMTASGDRELLKEAEERLRTLLDTAPVTAEMLNVLALTELRMGKTEDAVHSLEQALAKAPAQLMSSVMLSLAKLAQQDFAGAEAVLKNACESAPKSPEARVILARFYYSRGRAADAETQARRALEINPAFGPALMDMGRLHHAAGRKKEAEEIFRKLSLSGENIYRSVYALYLFQEGRREEAVQEFERVVKLDPEDRIARTRLVSAYGAVNRKADAETVLADALRKNPRDLEALLQRAEMYISDGKYAQAEADINAVVRFKPDSAEVRYTLAKLQLARGNAHSYRQELTQALELNPYLLPVRLELAQALIAANGARAALDLLSQAPESQREQLPVLAQRNWALWVLGDLEQMRKGIDRGLARERSTELLLQDGLWKLRQNNPAGARAALEEALKLDPSDLRALAGLRQTYGKQGAEALKRVKEFAAKQPKSAPVQQFLGVLEVAGGDRTQARAAFTAAKQADPQMVSVDLSLIQLDLLDRKLDDARKRLQAIAKTNHNLPIARLWLGQVEYMKGDFPAALDSFAKVVEADPENPDALNNYAYLLAEHTNRLDEALKHAEKARARAPEDPAIADTLGWIYYRKGLYPNAVKHLEQSVRLETSHVPKFHLAMAYIKAGDRERGRSLYEAAQKLSPGSPEAEETRKLLDQSR